MPNHFPDSVPILVAERGTESMAADEGMLIAIPSPF
jgi:hypothetical protein